MSTIEESSQKKAKVLSAIEESSQEKAKATYYSVAFVLRTERKRITEMGIGCTFKA